MTSVPAGPGASQRFSYLLPAFINLSLPNARIDSHLWARRNGTQQLAITAGVGIGPHGQTGESFVPYGKYARAALMFLCTDAVRTGHEVIPVSDTYRGYMKQLGLVWNRGSLIEAVRQMQAVAACTITLTETTTRDDGKVDKISERFTISFRDHMVFTADRSGEICDAEPSYIELSPDFMRAINGYGRVPIRTDAWHHLLQHSKSAMALDIYTWLAYRLHTLKKPVRISWEQLHDQFGSETELKKFKPKFRQALTTALSVYPEANVTEFGDGPRGGTQGIMLKMSRNAIDSAWRSP